MINDQFQRLENLCDHIDLPVHKWHGDVSAHHKRKLLDHPQGVLLITPESLESSFVNRSNKLSTLFGDIKYVVIDEFHAISAAERGRQLRSLLYRLERVIGRPVRIVGLSATLGDWSASYAGWIRPHDPGSVSIITDTRAERRYRIGVVAFDRGLSDFAEDSDSSEDDSGVVPPVDVVDQMFQAFARTKSLIFANSRMDVEKYADWLNQKAESSGLPRIFSCITVLSARKFAKPMKP